MPRKKALQGKNTPSGLTCRRSINACAYSDHRQYMNVHIYLIASAPQKQESTCGNEVSEGEHTFHIPKYVMGVVTPGMSGTFFSFRRSPRSDKPQPLQLCLNNEMGVSAPYIGGFIVTDFQKLRSISLTSDLPTRCTPVAGNVGQDIYGTTKATRVSDVASGLAPRLSVFAGLGCSILPAARGRRGWNSLEHDIDNALRPTSISLIFNNVKRVSRRPLYLH